MKILIVLLLIFSNQAFAELTLNDLGVTETKAEDSFTLSKSDQTIRTKKLKRHEVLGLVTLGAMTATMFTGGSAMDSNVHMYLGMTTAALYFTTAYYSLTAPKPQGVIDRGRIKWHKGLAWIHFPAMILVPYLGYMYKKNEEDGKKHSALEKQHSTFAGLLYGSFALSATLMVLEF